MAAQGKPTMLTKLACCIWRGPFKCSISCNVWFSAGHLFLLSNMYMRLANLFTKQLYHCDCRTDMWSSMVCKSTMYINLCCELWWFWNKPVLVQLNVSISMLWLFFRRKLLQWLAHVLTKITPWLGISSPNPLFCIYLFNTLTPKVK